MSVGNNYPENGGSQPTFSIVGPQPALSIRLSKTFDPPVGQLLDNFEITCHQGEIVALLGASGSGKTTILNIIAGLIPNDQQNRLSGSSVLQNSRINSVGLAFQRPELLPWRDAFGNARHEGEVLGVDNSQLLGRVKDLLEVTQLSEYGGLYPTELSQGMRQRIQLVRVLACPRDIMLFDEPLGAVDQPMRLRIAEAARHYLKCNESATLWVTHDSLEAVTVADTVLVLGGKPLRVVLHYKVHRNGKDQRSEVDLTNISDNMLSSELNMDEQAGVMRKWLLKAMSLTNFKLTASDQDSTSNRTPRMRWSSKTLVLPLIPILTLLGVWESIALLYPDLRFYLSAPSEWIPILFSGLLSGELLGHLQLTVYEAGLGLVIGAPIGILVGFGTASSINVSAATRPFLVGMSAVPLFVLAPAFILWFGIGIAMKIAIASLSAFPFVAYMTHDGAVDAKGTYYRYLKAHARPWRLFSSLVIPYTLEGIIKSLRPAAVAALIGAFLGEFIASNEGLGYYIILQASRYHVAEVFAGVSLLFVVAILIDWVSRLAGTHRHKLIASGRALFHRIGVV